MRRLVLVVAASVAAIAFLKPAEARPQYHKAFGEEYPGLKEATGQTKCKACHCGEQKAAKTLNDYGEALRKALKVKNVKKLDIVREEMRRVEKEPSAVEGKTFGDLIREGRLPGTCPELEEPQASGCR